MKRHCLNTTAAIFSDAITPSPKPSSRGTGTPSFQDLYMEEALEGINIPVLQDPPPLPLSGRLPTTKQLGHQVLPPSISSQAHVHVESSQDNLGKAPSARA
jgi:hypothetical protein